MKQGKIYVNRGNLTYTTNSGASYEFTGITTGRQGRGNPVTENYGPIPPGKYILKTKNISGGLDLRWIKWNYSDGDWGLYRVALEPMEGTEVYGRSGFFMHGGEVPGSAGCIDVARNYTLFILMMTNDDEVVVEVSTHANVYGWEYGDYNFTA